MVAGRDRDARESRSATPVRSAGAGRVRASAADTFETEEVPRVPAAPARALPPEVYRRRRIGALAIVALLVALSWFAISLFTGRGGDEPAPAAEPTATETATPTPTPTRVRPEDVAPKPTTEATHEAAATPERPAPCTAADVTVTAKLNAESFAPDQKPQLALDLTNRSGHACVINAGTSAQKYEITSGSDLIWDSTHCMTDPQLMYVALQPGETKSAPSFEWVRERSTPETCQGARPAAVGGGATYSVVATVDSIQSAPLSFVLE